MPERASSGSAAWIDPRHVRPAFALLPAAQQRRCATETTVGAGWHLVVEERTSTRLLPLDQPIVHVGRSPQCELCIDHPTVAPHHAALAVRRAGVLLFTEHATGRTFVNGRRVTDRAQLGDYDIVLFGDAMVVVRWVGARIADPLGQPTSF